MPVAGSDGGAGEEGGDGGRGGNGARGGSPSVIYPHPQPLNAVAVSEVSNTNGAMESPCQRTTRR